MKKLLNSQNKIIKFLRAHYLFVLLNIFIILPYILNKGEFLAGNDYGYIEYASEWNFERILFHVKDLNGVGGTSFPNAGTLPYYFGLSILYNLFGIIGTQIITKFIFYALGYFGIYYLIKEVSKKLKIDFKEKSSSMVSFFFCTNLLGFDLIRTWLNQYYIFYLCTPFLIYFMLKYLRTGNKKNILLFVVITILSTSIFVNPSYPMIQYLAVFIFFIIFYREEWKRFLLLITSSILINITSFIEYIMMFKFSQKNLTSSSINQYLIETAPENQERFFSTDKIINFTGGRLLEGLRASSEGAINNFELSDLYSKPFFIIVSFIPIFLILTTFLKRKQKPQIKYIQLFTLLGFLGISMFGFSLIKPVLEILYSNISSLWIFRNTLKFTVILIPLAAILIYISIYKKESLKKVFLIYLIVINFYSFSGFFADTASFTKMPDNYKNLQKTMESLDKGSADRIISFPPYGNFWLAYNFKYRGFNPLMVFQNEIPYFITTSDSTNSNNGLIYQEFQNLENLEKNPEIWEKYNIKYVFLQNDLSYKAYKIDEDLYYKSKEFLDKNFKKISENNNYSIYQTYEKNNSIIKYNNQVEYQIINPTKYKISIQNIKEKDILKFEQQNNPNWELKILEYKNLKLCEDKKRYYPNKIIECEKSTFIDIGNLNTKKTIYKNKQKGEIDDIFNTWIIDPDYIKNNYKNLYYRENPDGSINVELLLIFKPQSYYYLGLTISLITIISLLFYSIEKNKLIKISSIIILVAILLNPISYFNKNKNAHSNNLILNKKKASIDLLWEKTVTKMLKDDLWNQKNAYDSSHFLMTPMYYSYKNKNDQKVEEFRTFFRKLEEENFQEIYKLNDITKTQFTYFVSEYLVLEKKYYQNFNKNLFEKTLLLTKNEWEKPITQWGMSFTNLKERIEWKISDEESQKKYYKAITDKELFIFSTLANLRYVNNNSKTLFIQNEVMPLAKKVYEKNVYSTNKNKWLFQPGVWSDHRDYLYAGTLTIDSNMKKSPIENISWDTGHSHRFPLWLLSLERASELEENRNYYKDLRTKLTHQFKEVALVYPSDDFPNFRTTNYIDGNNGLYRYGYKTQGENNAYRPFEMSGIMLIGWWSFLPNNAMQAEYCVMSSAFPLPENQIKTYLGPDTTRDRNEIIKSRNKYTSGILELNTTLSCYYNFDL